MIGKPNLCVGIMIFNYFMASTGLQFKFSIVTKEYNKVTAINKSCVTSVSLSD